MPVEFNTSKRMPEKKLRARDAFDWKQQRVKDVLAFLERNARWNKEFQEREYRHCLASCTSPRERLDAFLRLNVTTQSEADMDGLSPFWQRLHRASDEQVSSLGAFIVYLADAASTLATQKKNVQTPDDAGDVWTRLFQALNAHPGWGEKTTALFVKATIKLHRGDKALHFWNDAVPEVSPVKVSKPFLPVDRVILHVFRTLGHPCPSPKNINRGLRASQDPEQMLTWDDLWFWGFFTQSGTGEERVLGWNAGKFWSQRSSAHDDEAELMKLGEEFLALITV